MEEDKKVIIKEIKKCKTYEELYSTLENYKIQINIIIDMLKEK